MKTKDLPAGDRLDKLVAEKVMGWTDWRDDRVKPLGQDSRIFRPSKDIACCWDVITRMREEGYALDSYSSCLQGEDGEVWSDAVFLRDGQEYLIRAETFQRAVCLAALQAKGVVEVP